MLSINPKSVVDGIRELLAAWKKRRNPARAQAQRLLDAFDAHGVARVQIPRLLPEASALPNADFADPDEFDLIDPPPGRDSEWRRILWRDARAMLESDLR